MAGKDIANTAYEIAIIRGLAVGYSMIHKKLIRFDVGEPAQPDITEFVHHISGVVMGRSLCKNGTTSEMYYIHLFVIKGRRPLTHHISSITVNQ